ncbi:hypothetical protein PRZ48_008886 [Zasmidium cellare]|uniref:Uncharacterized protein n=1 Tax=Zasmidium cellare TaxID=395010 RepID=A0ABR0EGV3_ZASCE|nr:hypothetical protein PRZ48_008886 [Zasmidium cellare]
MKSHLLTQSCKEAARTAQILALESVGNNEVSFPFNNYLSMSMKLHDILECTLLSGRLFATIKPWGEGSTSMDQWLLRTSPAVQTEEIRKLKHLVFRALVTAIAHSDADKNGDLLDAILLLTTSTTLTDGWDHTPAHQGAILWLAQAQLFRKPVSRDEFIGRPLCDAFSDVVFSAVRPSQRWKCLQVLGGDIRVMRAAAYDYVERLTHNFSRMATKASMRIFSNVLQPADFAASYGHQLIQIGSIAASVDEIESGLQ